MLHGLTEYLHPAYMKMLLDGKENLEELFADLGQSAVKDMVESQVEHSYILPGFAALAKLKNLPEKIICFLSSIAKEEDSNRIL